MKKLLLITCMAIFTVFMTQETVTAQERGNDSARLSPNASVSQTIGTTVVTVTYGRPMLKDREVFMENSPLAPLDRVWRTGANESTAITFSDDVMLGAERVPAGTYSLYTIPRADAWHIIINEKLSWGTQYDESQDVVRVEATPMESPVNMEAFTIVFTDLSAEKATMTLMWGDTMVPVPITVVN